ncbi:MAG TPA: prepilin-type N-terminal cleavage/methylation domain-containing protein [Acidimicrobiales bacterium]|nr:prepilin-type N-terminal cleavage/methylation domain-containing protein [Acidimicrobiales bacterium]
MPGESGFSLVEVIVAITVLALSVTFVSSELVTSSTATGNAQTRLVASEIASQTLQQAENEGYGTVSEGIDCTTTCTPSDPNNHLSQIPSNSGCWYYEATPGGKSATMLVPTTGSQEVQPTWPYTTPAPNFYGKSYLATNEDGVNFTIATYPMFDTNAGDPYGSSGVNCTTLTNGTAPEVPLIVVVEVSWPSAKPTQYVSTQTVMYTAPQPVPTSNSCAQFSTGQGAHAEPNLAIPTAQSQTQNAGAPVSIYFVDEKPTVTPAGFCVTDTNGVTNQIPPPLVTVTWWGSNSSLPFRNDLTEADPPTTPTGSTPNGSSVSAKNGKNTAPTPGTWCNVNNGAGYTGPITFPGTIVNGKAVDPPSGCNVEAQLAFNLPKCNLSDNLATVTSVTVGVWDDEQDLDTYTWTINNPTCP